MQSNFKCPGGQKLEKTNEKELNDSLESEEDLMRNSIILDF